MMQYPQNNEQKTLSIESILTQNHLFYVFLFIVILSLLFFVFPSLNHRFHVITLPILMLMSIIAGWQLGVRGGMVYGLISALAMAPLGFSLGFFNQDHLMLWGISGLGMIILGLGYGRIHDLDRRLHREMEDLELLKEENRVLRTSSNRPGKWNQSEYSPEVLRMTLIMYLPP